MHKAAKGQDLGQSGTAGFSCVQQGIPSDVDAMSVSPAGAAAIATDGAAVGTIRRLTTARIESRRDRTGQSFTLAMSHMLRCKKRADPFTLSPERSRQRSKGSVITDTGSCLGLVAGCDCASKRNSRGSNAIV
jgi:hypothetical protein